jgi:hypothetical protein
MNVPVNDFYSLLISRLDLACGDQFHWKPEAYEILGKTASESIVRELASLHRQADRKERKTTDRGWIVGTWRSYRLNYGDFWEWKGTAKIELVATSPKEIGLFLISVDSERYRAPDTEPSIFDDTQLFFGPIGSGLLFRYTHPKDDVLILDLESHGSSIHAELRRD